MSSGSTLVGHCPKCSAAIYAQDPFQKGASAQKIYSCNCHKGGGSGAGKNASSSGGMVKYGWTGGATIKDG